MILLPLFVLNNLQDHGVVVLPSYSSLIMPCQRQFSPCCGTCFCKPPNSNSPDGEQNTQFSEFPDLLPSSKCLQAALSLNSSPLRQHMCYRFDELTSTAEAQQVWLWNKLHGNAKVKFVITNQVLEGKQQQKQLPVYLSLWDFSGAQKPRKQISSALLLQRYLRESASLLRFCPPCDSDSCQDASWVQMKYQIISWGLQFPFLLIF